MGYRLSVLVFGFGSFYFLIRHLVKEEFGTWALFLTITTIIEMSRNGLVQNALIKFMHVQGEGENHNLISATWLINAIYTIVIYLLLLLGSGYLASIFRAEELQDMFIWYGITLFLLIPFSQLNYIQQGRFSFSGMFWSTLLRQGVFFVCVVIIYINNISISLTDLVLLQAGCTAMGLVCAYLCARKFLGPLRFSLHRPSLARVFHFGKFVMATNVASLLFKSVDQFFVGLMLNPGAVAIYNSAIRLSNLIEYPATSVSEIVYPQSAYRYEREGESATRHLYEKSVGLTLAFTIPIVVLAILFAKEIILLIAGPDYLDAVPILRITMLFGFFTPFNRQFGTAMDSTGRPHLNFYILLLSLFVNIVANYLLITRYGLIGAAYGTLAAYCIIFCATQITMTKIFHIDHRAVVRNTFSYYTSFLAFARNQFKMIR